MWSAFTEHGKGPPLFITHERDIKEVHTGAAAMTKEDQQHGFRVGKVDLV